MKKVSMILVAVAFAATGISAGKMGTAEKECRKKADEGYAAAKTSHKDAMKDCNAKKGKEKTDCRKNAAAALKEAGKAKTEAYKQCKQLASVPEVPAIPGAPSIPGMGK
jgi:hypothetical protein